MKGKNKKNYLNYFLHNELISFIYLFIHSFNNIYFLPGLG